MPHGQRDWGNIGADETVHGLADLAELAARLGSPVTFNREGNVLFLETFEHGIKNWTIAAYGTGGEYRWSAEKSRMGSYSCLLIPGTDGAQTAQMARQFPYPVFSRFGVEMGVQAAGDPLRMDVTLYVYDGTTRQGYTARYDHVNERLQLQLAGATWQTVAENVLWSEGAFLFHTIKLVADLNEAAFVRLIFDNEEYNIEAYSAFEAADATAPAIWVWFTCLTQTGLTTNFYVDDIIITQNEP